MDPPSISLAVSAATPAARLTAALYLFPVAMVQAAATVGIFNACRWDWGCCFGTITLSSFTTIDRELVPLYRLLMVLKPPAMS